MSKDLIDRLRAIAGFDTATNEMTCSQHVCWSAADEIERLERELETERALSFRNQVAELEQQRDELLAELDKLIDVVANIGMISGIYDDEQAALEHAAKALARVKKSK